MFLSEHIFEYFTWIFKEWILELWIADLLIEEIILSLVWSKSDPDKFSCMSLSSTESDFLNFSHTNYVFNLDCARNMKLNHQKDNQRINRHNKACSDTEVEGWKLDWGTQWENIEKIMTWTRRNREKHCQRRLTVHIVLRHPSLIHQNTC